MVKGDCNVPSDNLELLQIRLRQEISGKRYLLVLDDVWNEEENKWEQLRDLLKCGDLGSTVLVTARNNGVASIMGTVPSYYLRFLGDEDSWSLFHKRAFSKGVKECEELVKIGRELVKNSRGLPLAIKTLGSLTSTKSEVREWLVVLEKSKTWEQRPAKDEVLPVLRLSYDHLPSYMKQCFAFCAVFPKDYVMEKEKLVQYWMAHGFIPFDGPGDLEMTGSDIFNELVWRSFFQDVQQVSPFQSKHDYHSQTTCKMHDLIHDLAQSVTRDECLYLSESSQINNTPQCNVRHISLESIPVDTCEVIECFHAARSLISTGCIDNHVHEIRFVKFNFLRVLDLQVNSIENIMGTLGKMKHLRYLDISHPKIEIPEAITTLYLLQTLRLSCSCYSRLPEGMRYMISLRHLSLEVGGLKCMPPCLGELKNLQTLTCYIVGTGVGNSIGELKTSRLSGKLEVYNLREVRGAREARKVDMASKQNLDQLMLCWGMPNNYSKGVRSNGSEAMVVDLEVLDALKPCNKLKVLVIKEYTGDKFPTWMTEYHMLEKLVELHIFECTRCTNVPPFHRLPLLKKLGIQFMDNLRHLCCDVFPSVEGGGHAPITFPSLKFLCLTEMPNLQFWCEGDVGEKTPLIFPVLSELLIINCPKLSALPVTPLLQEIKITGNKTLSCFATGLTTPHILTLEIKGGRENSAEETLSFKSWEIPSLKPWVSLEELTIEGFNNVIQPTDAREGEEVSIDVSGTALRRLNIISSNFWFSPIPSNSPLWLWKCFRFIECLKIENCDSLISWPEEELSNLNYLQKIDVRRCRNFLGSLLDPRPEMSTRQVLLPKLKDLTISGCPNMVEVPNLWLPEYGSSVALKELVILSCESLNSIPSSIGGLTALEVLGIGSCMNLASLPEGMQGLEVLKRLAIDSCPKIKILPEGLLQRLRSLEYLLIRGCPLLERDFREHGKYWHLISEIRHVRIKEWGPSHKVGALTRLISSCKIPCLSMQS